VIEWARSAAIGSSSMGELGEARALGIAFEQALAFRSATHAAGVPAR
jgi:hypothetical protein